MSQQIFETQAEIWIHLINGGKVTTEHKELKDSYVYLKDGFLTHSKSHVRVWYNFSLANNWYRYVEPVQEFKNISEAISFMINGGVVIDAQDNLYRCDSSGMLETRYIAQKKWMKIALKSWHLSRPYQEYKS